LNKYDGNKQVRRYRYWFIKNIEKAKGKLNGTGFYFKKTSNVMVLVFDLKNTTAINRPTEIVYKKNRKKAKGNYNGTVVYLRKIK
jgi:hypothetical protein